jgi:hypothetical protein
LKNNRPGHREQLEVQGLEQVRQSLFRLALVPEDLTELEVRFRRQWLEA